VSLCSRSLCEHATTTTVHTPYITDIQKTIMFAQKVEEREYRLVRDGYKALRASPPFPLGGGHYLRWAVEITLMGWVRIQE
jgi:hypothetical protein